MITLLYVIFISWSHYSTSYLYRDYTTFCDVYTMITLPCAMFIPWSHYLLSYLHQSHYHTLYSCCVHTTLCHIIPWSHYILPYWYNGHTALCHVHTMITLRSVKFILVTPPHVILMSWSHCFMPCHTITLYHMYAVITSPYVIFIPMYVYTILLSPTEFKEQFSQTKITIEQLLMFTHLMFLQLFFRSNTR